MLKAQSNLQAEVRNGVHEQDRTAGGRGRAGGSEVRAEPQYQSSFGNHFASEAVPGALPVGRNSPQRPSHGLYTELISGTSFTAPRHDNRRLDLSHPALGGTPTL